MTSPPPAPEPSLQLGAEDGRPQSQTLLAYKLEEYSTISATNAGRLST